MGHFVIHRIASVPLFLTQDAYFNWDHELELSWLNSLSLVPNFAPMVFQALGVFFAAFQLPEQQTARASGVTFPISRPAAFG